MYLTFLDALRLCYVGMFNLHYTFSNLDLADHATDLYRW